MNKVIAVKRERPKMTLAEMNPEFVELFGIWELTKYEIWDFVVKVDNRRKSL